MRNPMTSICVPRNGVTLLPALALSAADHGARSVLRRAIPLIIAGALVVSGCGKKDEPAPQAPPPAPVLEQGAPTPSTAVPDRPAPDTANKPVGEYPKPGQVNNHSSPEFKGGGKDTK